MSTAEGHHDLTQRGNRDVKILPNPSAFFEILGESDVAVRSEKLNAIELCIEDNDVHKDGTQNYSWQSHIPELLQRLAGGIYIEKERLKLLGSLGEGGFAVVDKMELWSEDKRTHETVAVKKLKPGVIEDDEDLKELVGESNLLSRVRHKFASPSLLRAFQSRVLRFRGIVEFKGIGCFDKTSVQSMRESIFLAEEFMSGGTLKSVILDQMRVGHRRTYWMEDAWRWLIQVAEALCYLHSCTPSVVHRDLKPENVLMSSRDCEKAKAKIADFGLHKRINKVTMLQRAKSTNLLDSLTNDSREMTFIPESSKETHPRPTAEGIAIPKAKRRASTDPTDVSFYTLDIPSHFRIIKKSASLSCSHQESLLWMVPEDSALTESDVEYQHLSSAFSVPQALIEEDFAPIHMVSASPSRPEASSLHQIVNQMQLDDEVSEKSGSNDSSASLETHCSELLQDKKVRGGQLGHLLGLSQRRDTTEPSKKSEPSGNVRSPFERLQLEAKEEQLSHFLFEPNRSLNKTSLETKQHGSSNALDQLQEEATSALKREPRAADARKSVKFTSTSRLSLGLSGTTDISGVVGSLMYMAPEVYKGKHYNEKVDVFGFGVIMHELLLSELVMVRVLLQAKKPSEMQHTVKKHAKSVAKGHREEIPDVWPLPVKRLIQDCWNQQPDARPRMSEVVERLKSIKLQGCIEEMDQRLSKLWHRNSGCCTCCVLT